MQRECFRFRAMGSPCEIQLWAPDRESARAIAQSAADEIARLERKYSRYREDSLAARINRSAGSACGVEVDEETAALIDFADTAHRESDGRFDPTSGVLRRIWDFRSGRLPSDRAIRETLRLVGWSRLRWERPRLTLPVVGMELDFGGFVKEYAADRAAEHCRGLGATGGLVDLGGDLAVVGPHPDGSAWQVGIRHPRRPEQAMARIALHAGGLATSGDYERCMIVDGRRYSHLLEPRTGRPFEGGPACVSVTADHCLVAGVTSTIAMLHADTEAEAFLTRVGLPHLGVTGCGRVFGDARLAPPSWAPVADGPPQVRRGKSTTSACQPSSWSTRARSAASTIEGRRVT